MKGKAIYTHRNLLEATQRKKRTFELITGEKKTSIQARHVSLKSIRREKGRQTLSASSQTKSTLGVSGAIGLLRRGKHGRGHMATTLPLVSAKRGRAGLDGRRSSSRATTARTQSERRHGKQRGRHEDWKASRKGEGLEAVWVRGGGGGWGGGGFRCKPQGRQGQKSSSCVNVFNHCLQGYVG